jgi:ribosomal protein S18 acetylase RimI-like enzyme
MNVDIRTATLNDIPALGRLYHAFHEFHVAGIPGRLVSLGSWEHYDATLLKDSLQKILDSNRACIFVAEGNGTLVGFVEVHLQEDEPDPARMSYMYGHLQSLMVCEGWRRNGLGKRLVCEAERWAAKRGAVEMRLDTWEFDDSPVGFYEKIGYRTLKRKFIRGL